jgi:hypothetical protein
VVIAQWLQPIMMRMLQQLSTASRLLDGTQSKVEISSSVQSLLTLLESSDFTLGKGIALMFAKVLSRPSAPLLLAFSPLHRLLSRRFIRPAAKYIAWATPATRCTLWWREK